MTNVLEDVLESYHVVLCFNFPFQTMAARVAAEAAIAVHSGDVDGAARAVLEAARHAQCLSAKEDDKHHKDGASHSGPRSKACIIL